jgi:hypothetical protein
VVDFDSAEAGPGEEVDRLSRRVSEARLRLRLRWMRGCEGECGEVGVVGVVGDGADEAEAEEIGEVVIGEGVDGVFVFVMVAMVVGDIVKKVSVMGKGQTSGAKGEWVSGEGTAPSAQRTDHQGRVGAR